MTDPMIAVNSVNHQPPPAHALGRALYRPDGHPPRVVTIWKPMILVDRGFSSPEYGQDRNVSGAVVITSYGGGLGSGSRYAEHRIICKTQHEPGESTDRTATQSKHRVPSWTQLLHLASPIEDSAIAHHPRSLPRGSELSRWVHNPFGYSVHSPAVRFLCGRVTQCGSFRHGPID